MADGRIARAFAWLVVGLRHVVVLAWIAAAVAATLYLPGLDTAATSPLADLVPKDADAAKVAARSTRLFGSPLFTDTLVVQRDRQGLSLEQQQRTATAAREVSERPPRDLELISGALPITNAFGFLSREGERSTTAVTYLFFSPAAGLEEREDDAHKYADRYLARPGAHVVGVTGAAPARLEQFDQISSSLPLIEIASALLIALIVAVHFRSVAAPLVTLFAAAIAYLVAVRVLAWGGDRFDLAVAREVEPLVVVLLLGLVTDYSVFFMSAMRRGLEDGESRVRAARAAAARTLPLVVAAGLIVAFGVAALVVGRRGVRARNRLSHGGRAPGPRHRPPARGALAALAAARRRAGRRRRGRPERADAADDLPGARVEQRSGGPLCGGAPRGSAGIEGDRPPGLDTGAHAAAPRRGGARRANARGVRRRDRARGRDDRPHEGRSGPHRRGGAGGEPGVAGALHARLGRPPVPARGQRARAGGDLGPDRLLREARPRHRRADLLRAVRGVRVARFARVGLQHLRRRTNLGGGAAATAPRRHRRGRSGRGPGDPGRRDRSRRELRAARDRAAPILPGVRLRHGGGNPDRHLRRASAPHPRPDCRVRRGQLAPRATSRPTVPSAGRGYRRPRVACRRPRSSAGQAIGLRSG